MNLLRSAMLLQREKKKSKSATEPQMIVYADANVIWASNFRHTIYDGEKIFIEKGKRDTQKPIP
jgi:hypothetical protein